MSNQRWLSRNIFVLIFCVAISQATLFRNIDVDPVSRLAGGLQAGVTNLATGLVNTKNKAKQILHDVSPHVLGPASEALDPEWLTGMNYTRFVLDMQSALMRGNNDEWVKTITKMFNVEKVTKEIQSSQITKASCLACKFLINTARHMMKSGKTDQEIATFAAEICTLVRIEPAPVCHGILNLVGIDAIYAIRFSGMRPSHMCTLFLGEACLGGSDPRHEWKVKFPPTKKPANHITQPPPDNVPRLKVLQITDTHYDPYYQPGSDSDCDAPMCCRATSGKPKTPATAAGRWGDYRKCDSPKHLIENAFQHIVDTHKDIDYIIWTGDLPPHDVWNQTREENLKNIIESHYFMDKYFKGIPILPAVGNHESCPVDSFVPPNFKPDRNMSYLYDRLAYEWSRWLPPSAIETVRVAGCYSVLVRPGLRIISVNGNYCSRNNFFLMLNSTDPLGQLAWLINELDSAEKNGEKVHILNHIPPGQPDCLKTWSRNYYEIVNRYEATIMAQFYGHTHFDEFEVFYDTQDSKRPVGVGYIAPSITTWKDCNPAYRIYYVDGDYQGSTRAILDHETWKMNLDQANLNDHPRWYKSYDARSEYNMSSLLPKDWDDLIHRMAKDKNLFNSYHRNYYRDSPTRPKCDDLCKRNLLCDLKSAKSHDQQNLCRNI